jgi:AcrR family transcriptional regulator
MVNGRRERKDAQRNLERVLQAAHELFAERGSDVTMEEVARRAGVGVGTIYRRFPSKEHLWAAVSHAACMDAQQCIHEATARQTDPLGKLRALIVVQYRRSEEQAALLDMRPEADGESCAAGADQQQLYATLHAMLQEVITDGQRLGTIRAGDPAVLAALCLELLHPRTFLRLRHVVGGSAEDCAEHTVEFIVAALSGRNSCE